MIHIVFYGILNSPPDERGVTNRVSPLEIVPVDSGDDAKMDSLVFIL